VATSEQLHAAVAAIEDPLLDRTLGELDAVAAEVRRGSGQVTLRLPVPGYPAESELRAAAAQAARDLGVADVTVDVAVMSDEQRRAAVSHLQQERSGESQSGQDPDIPFNRIDSDTKVVAIASGKGGVGKSSIATNLACALAQQGYRVGIMDADIWGYSIPRMMGVEGKPVAFDDLVMPLRAHGCKVISIGFFVDSERPVIWRGPMLHRALQQFLADVHWGELDFLLCDLPPGTGDIAISLAQMLPSADMLVTTTPQPASQRVALRAGQTTAQTGMKVAGVIENMSVFVAPDTGTEYAIFGSGGGKLLADELDTNLLGQIPIDQRLREGADDGRPLVLGDPDAPASKILGDIASQVAQRKGTLVGKSLPLQQM
jgi:ATP-binding protein involved in chromosome partitioning